MELYSLQYPTFHSTKHNLEDIENFLNPLFSSNSRILYPVADAKKLQLWTNYYMRWDKKMRDQEPIEKKTKQLRDKYPSNIKIK
jgi:hypothetical protein